MPDEGAFFLELLEADVVFLCAVAGLVAVCFLEAAVFTGGFLPAVALLEEGLRCAAATRGILPDSEGADEPT